MPGPINRASIKPPADSRLRLSRVPWHNSPLQTNRRWLRWRRTSPQRHQNHIRRLFAVDAAVSSSFASNERRFWPPTTRFTFEGQRVFTIHFEPSACCRISPSVFAASVLHFTSEGLRQALLLRLATRTLAAIRQHIAWLLFMLHLKHSLGIRFATPHHLSLFQPHQNSPPALRVSTSCSPLVSRWSIISVDKSNDVISRRQQISQRLNVRKEDDISMFDDIYIPRPGFLSVKSSSSPCSLIKRTLYVDSTIVKKATCRQV